MSTEHIPGVNPKVAQPGDVHENRIDCQRAGRVETHWEDVEGYGTLRIPVSCTLCGRTWVDEFTFVGSTITSNPNNGRVLLADGGD